MVGAMALALIAVNSPYADIYEEFHHVRIHFGVGILEVEEPLVNLVNDGLMAFFFLLVGLEIKREALEGRLSTPAQIALPGLAALGGMVLPAMIYAALNWSDPIRLRGWAIPTATDIVLALGLLSLLGSRVPVAPKVFLTALAIFDDIGAVLIVGLFYGEELSVLALTLALGSVFALTILNYCKVTRLIAYGLVGFMLWLALQRSGIHPTLAGVMIGLAVPMRVAGCACSSPLREAERGLHPWVTLGIVPLFAFFNAGISLEGTRMASVLSPVSLGIVLGLFWGKQLGILGAVLLATKLNWARLPKQTTLVQIYGVALLGGVGFTMSLFVSTVAFEDTGYFEIAKTAVLIGSFVSASTGLLVLAWSTREVIEKEDSFS